MSQMQAGIDDFARMRDDYKQQRENLNTCVKKLDTSLRSSVWKGQAKARFDNDWNTIHKPNLLKLMQALDDCHKEMESRRDWTEKFEKAGAHGPSH
jgi:uncharacterized protein YukE